MQDYLLGSYNSENQDIMTNTDNQQILKVKSSKFFFFFFE